MVVYNPTTISLMPKTGNVHYRKFVSRSSWVFDKLEVHLFCTEGYLYEM